MSAPNPLRQAETPRMTPIDPSLLAKQAALPSFWHLNPSLPPGNTGALGVEPRIARPATLAPVVTRMAIRTDQQFALRRCPARMVRIGRLGMASEVLQNPLDDGRILDARDHLELPAAAPADLDVDRNGTRTLTRKERFAVEWDDAIRAEVIARFAPDSARFLAHCGKPADFWSFAS